MYYQIQYLDQKSKEIQQNLQQIDQQLGEFTVTKNALGQIKDIKEGTEILVPVSPGIFLRATLQDNQKVVVNVGSGVTVEKPVENAKDMISEQRDELEKIQSEMVEQLKNINSKIQDFEKKIRG